MSQCNEPQAHPDRCGCEPEVPVGYVSGERFHAEHERLRECRKERDAARAQLAALEAENARLKREVSHWQGLAVTNRKVADDALALLAAIQQAKGEADLTGEYHTDVNALLSRLSAMAAEVERLQLKLYDYEHGDLDYALKERDALRAELAAVKGQEPTLAMVQAACAAFRMDISPMQAMHEALRAALSTWRQEQDRQP